MKRIGVEVSLYGAGKSFFNGVKATRIGRISESDIPI